MESGSGHYLCAARAKSRHLLEMLEERSPSTKSSEELSFYVGPEGGWTDEEIDQAIAKGIQTVTLGKSILRAVTAAIATLTIVNAALTTRDE